MEKYSKSKLKMKRNTKFLFFLLILIFVISFSAFIYVIINNNIIKENIDYSCKEVSDNEAINSAPIIVNNLVVGATYENKWVSSERYYVKGINKNGFEVDLFSKSGKLGTYELKEVTQKPGTTSVYTTTTRANLVDEYFAVAKGTLAVTPKVTETNKTSEDEKYVKKALGIYKFLNTSVNVNKVYDVSISDNIQGKVIIASSMPGKSFGAYTCAVFVDNTSKVKLIKYNYIRNLKDSSQWPVYFLEFIADLNGDMKKELVLVETKEFETKYDVIEYRDGKFYEVLSSVIK